MKSTGMVRKIDELGRLVLPKELRNYLNINSGDNLEIFIDSNRIILEKYNKLESFEESINKIISCFLSDNKYRVLFCIDNMILNDKSILSFKIKNLIKERKVYINKNIETYRISSTIEEIGKIIINPLIINSDLIGSVIIVGNIDIEYMLNISNIINNLIKKIILFA